MTNVNFLTEDIIDEKRGRISKDSNHASDVQLIKKLVGRDLKSTELTQYIKAAKSRFLKLIDAYDSALLDGLVNPSLEQLKKIADDNGLSLKKSLKTSSIPSNEIDDLMREEGLSKEKAIIRWKALRRKYINMLLDAGQKLSDDAMKSLEGLKNVAVAASIDNPLASRSLPFRE